MLNEGIYSTSQYKALFLSHAQTEKDIAYTTDVINQVFSIIKNV